MKRSAVLLLAAVVLTPLSGPLRAGDPPPSRPALAAAAARAGLRPAVLAAALRAQARALRSAATEGRILTIIDYSLPSRARRLWVLDLARDSVLAHELVAHGRNTGDDLARRFSNRPGSLQSSLGTFVTGPTYQGRHGISLRLRGLDRGVNDRAEARAIVVHGADYVSPDVARRLGRLGRSQGCPALEPAVASRIIGLIRGGSVLFAWHPTLHSPDSSSPS